MITQQQIQQYLKENSIYGFIKLNGILTEKGTELNWKQHKFLFDIYDDWSPIIACIKASQIGFSTMAILKVLYASKYKKWNIIYTLPSAGDVNTFVSSKVNPIINNNLFLKNLVQDKDTIFQKQIGNSVIFFKGTISGKAAEQKTESSTGIMISSDLNVHDEADRSDQVILEQFESRLDFSQYKGRWYFSNPTVPNIGAHKWFIKSDQKHWFHKCSRCNEWFYLEWNDLCVDRNKRCYLCPKCHQPLRDEDRNNGEWVKKWNNRDISGYWINQMMASWKSCDELLTKEAESSKSHFNNFCLGLPYIGSDIVVNREIIVNNIILTKNEAQNCAMGVDNGVIKHYVLGNDKGIFKVGKTKDWDEIERLIQIYKPMTVIDALPFPKKPTELVQKYKHRVYLNFYKKDKDDLKVIRWGKGDKSGTVYTDRTKIIDEVIEQMYSGKITFNMTAYELDEYIRHWESLYLSKVEDSMGIERTNWESSNGEDHLVHATIYWYLAMQRLKEGQGGTVKPDLLGEHSYSPVVKDGKIEDESMDIKYAFEEPKKNWDSI
jgi:hypothetical protein